MTLVVQKEKNKEQSRVNQEKTLEERKFENAPLKCITNHMDKVIQIQK